MLWENIDFIVLNKNISLAILENDDEFQWNL